MLTRLIWVLAFVVAGLTVIGQANDSKKASAVKGTIYRGDKSHPVKGAYIILLDQNKSGNSDNSVDATADENGNYVFDRVAAGRYTVSIRTWYDRQEDVPCQFLMGKTKDKDSSIIVLKDGAKFVEQIFIKGLSVKGGKDTERDFDIECKSAFSWDQRGQPSQAPSAP